MQTVKLTRDSALYGDPEMCYGCFCTFVNAFRRHVSLVREFLGKRKDKPTRGRGKFNDLYGCDWYAQNVDNDVGLAGDPVFMGCIESDKQAYGEDMLSGDTSRKVDGSEYQSSGFKEGSEK